MHCAVRVLLQHAAALQPLASAEKEEEAAQVSSA